MLALYSYPGTVAMAVDMALREAGAAFELRLVDFKAGAQREAPYLGINPKGRAPALVAERGVLTETPAILTWIAATWPQAGLAPDDAWEAARLQEFLAYLCSTVHVNHAHGPRAHRWADREESRADMKAKVPENMTAAYAHAETCLAGPWVMGDRYTVADPYLFVTGRWLEGDGLALADHPKLAAHRARMLDRPAVRASLAAHDLPAPPLL
jgi:glutathione S-transferase